MIDRDQLREALAWWDRMKGPDFGSQIPVVVEAARLVASEDTLIISKVDGKWPEDAVIGVTSALRDCGQTIQEFSMDACAVLDALLEGQPK